MFRSPSDLKPARLALRLGGLIRIADWAQGKGQGYALTPEGASVLESPRELARLRSGKLELKPEIQHGQVRTQVVGDDGMFRMESSRSKLAFDKLAMEVTLAPGQNMQVIHLQTSISILP